MKKLIPIIGALFIFVGLSALHANGNHDENSHGDHVCEPCKDGQDGQDGANGRDGLDGIDGRDGVDGVVDYSLIDKWIQTQREFTSSVNANNQALSAIDFGNTAKGETQGGIGFGVADWGTVRNYGTAIGVKHGIEDDVAVILKGSYATGGDASGVGLGFVKRF